MTTLFLASFIRSLITVVTVLKPEKGIWEFREGRRGGRGPISISHQLPTHDDDNGESADSWPQKKGELGMPQTFGVVDLWWAPGRGMETNNTD